MRLEEILAFFTQDHTDDDCQEFTKKMIEFNQDPLVHDFVKTLQDLVEENNSDDLEKHLQKNIPMSDKAGRVYCLTAVRNTCNYFMLYAAVKGLNKIVDVFVNARLLPQLVQYQGLSPDYIQAANEIIAHAAPSIKI